MLKEADAGVLVAPEDPGALLDAIIALREDPERRSNNWSERQSFRGTLLGKAADSYDTRIKSAAGRRSEMKPQSRVEWRLRLISSCS